MLESLSSKLQEITAQMRKKTRVTDQDIKVMMREIRLALLEADVNYQVVKDFVTDMTEKAKGQEVMKSLTPGQQIVKIVHESLVDLLGSVSSKIAVSPSGFTVVMLYGLQGAGKTTTAAKLAGQLKKSGKKPIVTSVDVHRPAAAKQLEVLAEKLDVPSFIMPEEKNAVTITQKAIERAKYLLCDTLIVDTAGRMTIDQDMMTELVEIGKVAKPTEKLLVVDAMIGQEAVGVALAFEEAIGLDGFIMTKLDGDARGGSALSIRKMTGKPIKFICVGEKVEDIEEYHPDRMANRILGMGDVLSLIEKAQANLDDEMANATFERLMSDTYTLEDMLAMMQQTKKMGSLKDMMNMLPNQLGGGMKEKIKDQDIDEGIIDKNIAIISSMTLKERRYPKVLNASRRKRIAEGSGTTVQSVNQLLKQYDMTSQMFKKMGITGGKKGKKSPFKKFGKGGFPNLPF